MSEKYNGWANYATWRINLEITEEECEALRESGQRFDDVYGLAQYLENFVDEVLSGDFGGPSESLVVDYARAFVSDVDWYEIASHHGELIGGDEDDEDDEDDGEDEDQ